MWNWIKIWWCSVAHGGGHIKRDAQGRINWQCAKCGRWSDHPVSRLEEDRIAAREIETRRAQRSK